MSPKIDSFPRIPYDAITSKHFFYDLVYNPEKTLFLIKAQKFGAKIKNGKDMLHLQADKSWQIWNHQ
jgi:shikimate dehydrogenase